MQHLMPVLFDASVKSFAVLLLAWIVVSLMRRSSAAARHMVWTGAIVATLAMPALSYVLPGLPFLPRLQWFDQTQPTAEASVTPPAIAARDESVAVVPRIADVEPDLPSTAIDTPALPSTTWMPPLVDATQVNLSDATGAPITPAPPRASTAASEVEPPTATTPAPATAPSPSIAPRLQIWLPWLWLTGCVLTLLRLPLGWLSLWQLKRTATRVAAGPWHDQLRQLTRDIGYGRRVVLLKSPCRSVPMTWGAMSGILPGLPAVILIPDDADAWSSQRQRAVLLHELAHIKRRDCLAQLLTHLACGLYWFNPLTWLAARHMLVERERACDDMVLTRDTQASDYAQHLLDIATAPQTFEPGYFAANTSIAMARNSKLDGRVVAILDQHRNRRAMTRLGVVLTLTLIGAVAVLLAMLSAEQVSEHQLHSIAQEIADSHAAGNVQAVNGVRVGQNIVGHLESVGSLQLETIYAKLDRHPFAWLTYRTQAWEEDGPVMVRIHLDGSGGQWVVRSVSSGTQFVMDDTLRIGLEQQPEFHLLWQSPARASTPPTFRYVSFYRQREFNKQTAQYEATQPYWHPNGQIQDKSSERRLLGRFGESGNPDVQPPDGKTWLDLWFAGAAAAETSISGQAELLDPQGRVISRRGDVRSSGAMPELGNRPWLITRIEVPDQDLPASADVRLAYSQGAWEHIATLRPGEDRHAALPNGVQVAGLGTATGRQVPGVGAGDVYLHLASEQLQEDIRYEFGCELILRDGSTPGFMMSHKSGQGRPWELTFGWSEVQWEQVREFRIRMRPVHTVVYRNVSLQSGHETKVEVVAETAASHERAAPDMAQQSRAEAHADDAAANGERDEITNLAEWLKGKEVVEVTFAGEHMIPRKLRDSVELEIDENDQDFSLTFGEGGGINRAFIAVCLRVTPGNVERLLALQAKLEPRGYALDSEDTQVLSYVGDPEARAQARELVPEVLEAMRREIEQAVPETEVDRSDRGLGNLKYRVPADDVAGQVFIHEVTTAGQIVSIRLGYHYHHLPHLGLMIVAPDRQSDQNARDWPLSPEHESIRRVIHESLAPLFALEAEQAEAAQEPVALNARALLQGVDAMGTELERMVRQSSGERVKDQLFQHEPADARTQRRWTLHDIDIATTPAVFDLASGELLSVPRDKEGLQLTQHFTVLGKGDLAFDRKLIVLRGGTAWRRVGQELLQLDDPDKYDNATAYTLPPLPADIAIQSGDEKWYAVRLVSADNNAIVINEGAPEARQEPDDQANAIDYLKAYNIYMRGGAWDSMFLGTAANEDVAKLAEAGRQIVQWEAELQAALKGSDIEPRLIHAHVLALADACANGHFRPARLTYLDMHKALPADFLKLLSERAQKAAVDDPHAKVDYLKAYEALISLDLAQRICEAGTNSGDSEKFKEGGRRYEAAALQLLLRSKSNEHSVASVVLTS